VDDKRKRPQDGHRNLVVIEGTVVGEPQIVEEKWPISGGTYTKVECGFVLKNDACVW
jgi:hypothetical protein